MQSPSITNLPGLHNICNEEKQKTQTVTAAAQDHSIYHTKLTNTFHAERNCHWEGGREGVRKKKIDSKSNRGREREREREWATDRQK